MKHTLRPLLAACLIASAPLAAAEGKQTASDTAFKAALAEMTPQQKAPLAQFAIAQADAELQKSFRSDRNIEQVRLTYEAGNTAKYIIRMRHDPKMAEILADPKQQKLFGEFMAHALKKHICSVSSKELGSLNLLGIEHLHIQVFHSRQALSDSTFPIKECL